MNGRFVGGQRLVGADIPVRIRVHATVGQAAVMNSGPGLEVDPERALAAASELAGLADELGEAVRRIVAVPLPPAPVGRVADPGPRLAETAHGLGRLSAELAVTARDLRRSVERAVRHDRDTAAALRAIPRPIPARNEDHAASPSAVTRALAGDVGPGGVGLSGFGSGGVGSGDAGLGDAGLGDAGLGDAASGDAASGGTGLGGVGSGDLGLDDLGLGDGGSDTAVSRALAGVDPPGQVGFR